MRSRTDRDGARAPCGEPRATRVLWSFPEEVRPVRDREGCRDIGSGRGSRGSRRRAVIEPGGGDTRGRSVGRLNPFLTGRGGSRRGVNAGAHLRGVAHDDHAVTARHGLDEAVHPSRSLCHCWCARVRALVCRETRCLFRRGRKRTAIAVRCVRETDEVGKNAEISCPTRLLA